MIDGGQPLSQSLRGDFQGLARPGLSLSGLPAPGPAVGS